jgi:hypothetical protein
MTREWIGFGIGVLIGGLSLSACWGLFWLAVGTVGLIRGTCSWHVVVNSLTVGVVPLLAIAGLYWWYDGTYGISATFGMGLLGMPIVLLGFGLRYAPDGRRAGAHMLEGVRHLRDELLGCHHECGGCGEHHSR